jgi:hypothetical protein
MSCGLLVYFMVSWYIFLVLVRCTKKNLATLNHRANAAPVFSLAVPIRANLRPRHRSLTFVKPKTFRQMSPEQSGRRQGCQMFLGTIYQNGNKYTYQMNTKFSKWLKSTKML